MYAEHDSIIVLYRGIVLVSTVTLLCAAAAWTAAVQLVLPEVRHKQPKVKSAHGTSALQLNVYRSSNDGVVCFRGLMRDVYSVPWPLQ